MRRWFQLFGVFAVVASVMALTAGQFVAADPGGYPHVPGQVIIKFKSNATQAEKAAIKQDLRGNQLKRLSRIDAELLEMDGVTVDEAINRYKNHGKVKYIEPNYIVEAIEIPNDPYFSDLWGMRNTGQTGGTDDADIDADNAWDVGTGSHNVLVGVIDTGVDYTHPDLAANMWTNPGEVPGNGLDDDGNGFPDDVRGWDFYNDDNDPMDDNGHGTHCSGTIGAVGNNGIGVAGVNWHVSIVGIKFLSSGGSGSTADAIAAIDYATTIGVNVMSNSWGGGGYSAAMEEAIQDAYDAGILFAAAAGNGSSDTDVTPHYPSSYTVGNVVSVAATDHNDELASFSNWGLTSVDLGAPGVDILSTFPGNSYGTISGTSMATPHVAGTAALIWSLYPGMTVDLVKTRLLDMADPVPDLAGMCVSGARLNAFMSIAEPDSIPPAAITDLAAYDPTSNTIHLSWTATGDDGTSGTASYYHVRYSTSPITEANFDAATRAGNEPDPQPYGSPEEMEVHGLDFSTTYYFAVKAFDEFGNASPISNTPTGTTLGAPDIAYSPGSFTESLLTGETSTQTLTLSNEAEGTLDFTIPSVQFVFSASAPGDYLELGKGESDPRPGILGSGGPDGYGYHWIDSDEPGGPVFSWVDITSVGTAIPLTGDDSNAGPYPIGFTFPFYESNFDEFNICTNGFISFTNTTSPYSNQPLPNTGAPENLVAPFWDDLNFGTVQCAYMYNDGSRLIIQYNDVPHYSSGGPYTFEVILYPSGKIVYQYLSIGSPDNSATVGIQNATKDDGLQVAFNTTYVHDNLAVQIAAVPQWLSVSPESGRIYAGNFMDLDVDFDAAGLMGGDYDANIVIASNDPDEGTVLVPVTLHVTGAPDIAVNPTSLDFGTLYLGYPSSLTVMVTNDGTDDLTVTDVYTGIPEFTASAPPTPWTVTPGSGVEVEVTFTPSAATSYTDVLTIESNDSDEPTLTVPLSGDAVEPPVVFVDPTSLHADLFTGETEDQDLLLSNSGGTDYDYSVAVNLVTGSSTVQSYLDLEKDEEDPRPGILGSGGPDAFGYRWTDSDEPGGPAFNWVDITTVGTQIPLTGDDGRTGPLPVGFDFPFYGNTFGDFYISGNGFVSFETITSSYYTNQALPNSGAPANLLAPWWDDLYFGSVERAYYYNDGSRLIIEFFEVPHLGTGGPYTFEIILYPNGTILYQYLSMVDRLDSATIGIQNGTKDDGLTVVFNSEYVHDNMAIRIASMPQWLTVAPMSGTVPPDGSETLTAHFDASGLEGGDYEAEVVITGADPLDPSVTVPVTLHVTGAPDIVVDPTDIDFGLVYLGYSRLSDLYISNEGTDVLHVTDITSTSPDFSVDVTSFDVPPHGVVLVTARFSPTAVGVRTGELHVVSNDSDTPDVAVNVEGLGLVAPDIAWSPTSISADLMTDEIDIQTITLDNTGGSDLDYTVETRLAGTVTVHSYLEVEKGEDVPGGEGPADPRPGILGSGGPDAFGYLWTDSDESGGPTYDWVDISAIGTPVFGVYEDDDNYGPFPIGFDFPFYGNTFGEFRVCSNGWVSFTSTSTTYNNQPLPNAGGPENLLAVFWDDMVNDPTDGNEVYYYNDGSRLIIQYEVRRIAQSTPPYYSFEIILYPNGTIVYQYRTLGPTTNSATIGIQNATNDDGLTVVFNDDYVHEDLAIRIATTPQWLTVLPESGTIPPGGSATLTATFDATGVFGGDYSADVNISSNDPDEGLVTIPASLHVTGIPDIVCSPDEMDCGTVYVGFSTEDVMTVTNEGTDLLTVTNIVSDNPDFTVDITAFDLNPLESQAVTVTFAPSVDGTREGTLTVYSNDPDTPEDVMSMTGVGLIPPEIVPVPDSVVAAVHPDVPKTKTLQICNNGGSDLTFTLEYEQATVTMDTEGPDGGKTDPQPSGDPVIAGQGGPDAFGHTWIDSDEPGGPVFNWVDITGVGTVIAGLDGDDEYTGPIPIGFDFPFYGNDFNEFWASTNGVITFQSTYVSYYNRSLPSTYAYPNMIAPWWDDQHFYYVERAYYYYDGNRLIIEFFEVEHYQYSGTGTYTYEVILYPDGTIVYQYLTMEGLINSATIGIQNATEDDALQVVYNADYMHDNLAIKIATAPDWLSVSPTEGTVPAGQCMNLEVAFDAAGMDEGEYDGYITITSNDPYNPVITVPVHMIIDVIDVAWLDVDPNTLNLGSGGNYVTGYVELPTEYDAADIVIGTVLFEFTVPADPDVHSIGDENHNGIDDLMVKFDRTQVEALLSVGESVPVTVVGEVEDVCWFTGTDYIRVINPSLKTAPVGEVACAEAGHLIAWDPPEGYGVNYYGLYFSSDGGESWSTVADNIDATSYLWTPPHITSDQCLLRVYAFDDLGVMGYDTSDIFSLTATPTRPKPDDPKEIALFQNQPNPAMGATAIAFDLPRETKVSLMIFDASGKLVRSLVDRQMPPGRHSVVWDGKNNDGRSVSPGVYFYSFEAGAYKATKKLMLVQ